MTEKFLTTVEVGWMLGLNIKVVQRKMRAGEIPAIKMGGVWRATESELKRWMHEQRPQKRDVDYVY